MREVGPLDAHTVKEMIFADLYLGHPKLGNRFTSVPKAPANPISAGPDLAEDLKHLQAKCAAVYDGRNNEFRLIYDDVGYRVAVMETMHGPVYVLRKIEKEIYTLEELGIPKIYHGRLLQKPLAGLFIVVGVMNSGKTTTASSIISERLNKHGGVAVTAEDPVEVPLEGLHGTGICFQTHASREKGGYAESCRGLVRWGAEIIYLGEIRDADTAIEALRAGVNGHLVVSTLHAEDIQTALRRIHALTVERFDPVAGYSLMSDGMCGIMKQRLVGNPRRLEAELFMVHENMSARNIIRQGNFERLSSEIEMQKLRLLREPLKEEA
jgi:twitching motility protein PilT